MWSRVNKKVNKKRILYEGYKESVIKKEQQEKPDKKTVENIEKISKEKKIKRNSKTIPDLEVTLTIAVSSLENKCGCTYIAQAIAKYIKKEINSNVCMVNIGGKSVINQEDLLFFKSVDICNLYDKFKYIIIDVGNLNDRTESEKSEFKRANIKIMIAKNDEDYLKKIVTYIRQDNDYVKRWAFIFNQVAPKMAKKIDALMEDYEHYCMPLFYQENIDEPIKDIFYELLKKKRNLK